MEPQKRDGLKELLEEAKAKGIAGGNASQSTAESIDRWSKIIAAAVMLGLLWGIIELVGCVQESMPDDPAGNLTTSERADYALRCKDAVRAKANYGKNADFDFGYDIVKNGKGVFVKGGVNFMNGFGAMIPYTYVCRYEGKTLVEALVGKE